MAKAVFAASQLLSPGGSHGVKFQDQNNSVITTFTPAL
jgi:hypothetical protein